jgi:hypothetical protein
MPPGRGKSDAVLVPAEPFVRFLRDMVERERAIESWGFATVPDAHAPVRRVAEALGWSDRRVRRYSQQMRSFGHTHNIDVKTSTYVREDVEEAIFRIGGPMLVEKYYPGMYSWDGREETRPASCVIEPEPVIDMDVERQRRRRGNRRLTDEQVREIREQLGSKSITQLADEYGVGRTAIRDIKHGRSYQDVAA